MQEVLNESTINELYEQFKRGIVLGSVKNIC